MGGGESRHLIFRCLYDYRARAACGETDLWASVASTRPPAPDRGCG